MKRSPIFQEITGYHSFSHPFLFCSTKNSDFYLCISKVKDKERKAYSIIERKSLVPRLIYLSIKKASASLKESVEVNGCLSDPKIASELHSLLERYAKILGHSFSDAIQLIGEVCQGLNTSEVSFVSSKCALPNLLFPLQSCNLGRECYFWYLLRKERTIGVR